MFKSCHDHCQVGFPFPQTLITTPGITTSTPTLTKSLLTTLSSSDCSRQILSQNLDKTILKEFSKYNIYYQMIIAVLLNISTELFLLTKKSEEISISKLCHLKSSTLVCLVEEKFCFKKKLLAKEFDWFSRAVFVDTRTSGRLVLVPSRLSTRFQAKQELARRARRLGDQPGDRDSLMRNGSY